MNIDLQFQNLGPFAACYPSSEAGRDWLAEHVGEPDDGNSDRTWLDFGVVIEFDCLEAIVEGARADGLAIAG